MRERQATHGVGPKPEGSDRRWAMITAYRNPGATASGARWVTPAYSEMPTPGLSLRQKDHTYPGFEAHLGDLEMMGRAGA